jgi:AcrR family transcriptional regulator
MNLPAPGTAPRRGRPAGASRDDVLAAATSRYLRGKRVDVLSISEELGLGRTTIYRWFGTREELIGEILPRVTQPLLDQARTEARGRGADKLVDTFDRFNRSLVAAPALRQFVERERDAAVRIITSGAGNVQRRNVEMITEVIEAEVRAGAYEPPVEPTTLGYAIVRLAEAFIFNESATGMRDSVDRLREVEAALLGATGAAAVRGGGRGTSGRRRARARG